jgi:hypothetical protein
MKSLFTKFTKFTHWIVEEKNRKKGKRGAKKLTKEETLDFSDECNKKSHIVTKKIQKNKKKT